MKIVLLGLSISSSWGNGHATTYRSLVRELSRMGHEIWFLERDRPWYAENRDAPEPDGAHLVLYPSLDVLRREHRSLVRDADAVIVGSFVPDGALVSEWMIETARGVRCFYDIDTPVTLAKLPRREIDYLSIPLIPAFDFYLSFTGGPTLSLLERKYGAQRAIHLPCSADPERYHPMPNVPLCWSLGYLGTYSPDRQPGLEVLLLEQARKQPDRRFVVAGPQYPEEIDWPANVDRIEHLAPDEHAAFYSAQRFTLNVTRSDMVKAGWSPSVRLFEAAACAVPIVTDPWPGLSDYFEPGEEIIVADRTPDLDAISESEREKIGARARARVLAEHTGRHRAEQLERLLSRGGA